MITGMNSRERTYDEFVGLGREAGFEIEKVWDLGEMMVLEFRQA
jgi:hypothetical protein